MHTHTITYDDLDTFIYSFHSFVTFNTNQYYFMRIFIFTTFTFSSLIMFYHSISDPWIIVILSIIIEETIQGVQRNVPDFKIE